MVHLVPLISGEEWTKIKRDILKIYAEQNAKREALRRLIEFNSNLSMVGMADALLNNGYYYLNRLSLSDPLRDNQFNCGECLTSPFLLLVKVIYAVIVFCLCRQVGFVVDVLTLPRFILFKNRHRAFLEAVMTAHPDLDPVLVDRELIQKLRELTDNIMSDHPVNCRFTSIMDYDSDKNNNSQYYETFQIQFLKCKYAPC